MGLREVGKVAVEGSAAEIEVAPRLPNPLLPKTVSRIHFSSRLEWNGSIFTLLLIHFSFTCFMILRVLKPSFYNAPSKHRAASKVK